MKFKILIVFIFFLSLINNAYSENDPGYVELPRLDDIFYIGKMESHNNNFVLLLFELTTDFTTERFVLKNLPVETNALVSLGKHDPP